MILGAYSIMLRRGNSIGACLKRWHAHRHCTLNSTTLCAELVPTCSHAAISCPAAAAAAAYLHYVSIIDTMSSSIPPAVCVSNETGNLDGATDAGRRQQMSASCQHWHRYQ